MSDQTEPQLHLLHSIAACIDNQEAAHLIIFQNPCLLNFRIQEKLGEAIELLPQEERAAPASALELVRAFREMLEKKQQRYSIGNGPLEQILAQLAQGEISQNYAIQLAQALGVNDQLSLIYVRTLGAWLFSMALTEQWQQAFLYYRILMAAVESMPADDEARRAYWQVGLNWMKVVTGTLTHYGDYRIYRNAIGVGENIIQQADSQNDLKTQGEALHSLGILCLDPYHATRTNTGYEFQIEMWRNALASIAPDDVSFIPKEEWQMPEPLDALKTAEQYLRRAVEVRQGNDKGLSLKALVDTLDCRYTFANDKSVDTQELCSLAKQAFALLDQVRYRDYCTTEMAILMNYQQSIEPEYLDKLEQWLSAEQFNDYVAATNDNAGYDLLMQGTQILDHDRPLRALELLQNGQSLAARLAVTNEEKLIGFLLRENWLVARAYLGDLTFDPPEGDILEAAKQVIRNSIETSEEPHVTSAKLLQLAFISQARDQEDKGVTLLDWIGQLTPDLADKHRQSLTLLRFQLLYNHAAWAVNAGQADRSAFAYTRSLTPMIELGLNSHILECLTKIDDLARNHLDLTVALLLVEGLQPIALVLEYALGQPATFILQRTYKAMLPVLWTESGAEVAHTLIQIAKGARFAAVNQQFNASMVPDDEFTHRLLAEIRETEKALAGDDTDAADGIDEILNDLMLTSYDQDLERYPGSSLEQRFANLRRSYDIHLNQGLLGPTTGQALPLLDFPAIVAALDERTVLLNCFVGQTGDGEEAMNYLVACTHEEVFAVGTPTGAKSNLLQIGANDRKLVTHPIALDVVRLREDLNLTSPDGGPVAHKVAAFLENDLHTQFGSLVGILEELHAAGKDHLCIVPHGPLHYYPFHLLRANGKTLAEDWIVTYLPNLHLFLPGQRQAADDADQKTVRMLTSIGLSFEQVNPFHLDVLPQSITEASSVASAFGQKPVLEQEATRRRVIDALEHSRYVHLSTHGRHCLEAPAFQCVYLAGDETSDGRLFAFELLPLDLQSLEMVTLSACETALGRFDLADNVRGIPASLLLAGARTIVGTLWATDPDPAECFFRSLYQELRAGKNRLDAFAAAQQEVRHAYPRYIDWGAFYFIGDWR